MILARCARIYNAKRKLFTILPSAASVGMWQIQALATAAAAVADANADAAAAHTHQTYIHLHLVILGNILHYLSHSILELGSVIRE